MKTRIFVLEKQRKIPVMYELKLPECQQIKPNPSGSNSLLRSNVCTGFFDENLELLTFGPCITLLLVCEKAILFKFGLVKL